MSAFESMSGLGHSVIALQYALVGSGAIDPKRVALSQMTAGPEQMRRRLD